MIRPPPTGISLSSNDIAFHLQDIDVYHNLLKQGFKRKDIQRYTRDQRKTIANKALNSEFCVISNDFNRLVLPNYKTRKSASGLKRLSATISQGESSDESGRPFIRKSSSHNDHEPCQIFQNGPSAAITPPNSLSQDELAISSSTSEINVQTPTQRHPSTGTDVLQRHHVPRQSSLLRFSRNASSSEKSGDTQPPSIIPYSIRSEITWKPQTQPYSYEQSKIDRNKSNEGSLISSFEGLVLDESLVPSTIPDTSYRESQLRADAREFTPQSIQGYLTDNSKRLHHRSMSMDEDFNRPAWNGLAPTTSPIVPILQSQSYNYLVSESSTEPGPSSMFGIGREERDGALQPSSPTLPSMPSTPHRPNMTPGARTETREIRARYLDGQSFTPYNDSLPASVQPQTPADLSRLPLFGELNAAYTAPPGRLRNGLIDSQPEYVFDVASGEQSPTNRAISIRQRRNREYARSARIEGLRISRLRERHRTRLDEALGRGRRHNNMWEFDEHLNLWRDDLDADRAGEENFEDTEARSDMIGMGMRVISGNQQVNGS